jgi:two-component system phosphate regulon sensor histidine kinase PhoR
VLYGLDQRQGLRRSFFILPMVSLLSMLVLSVALATITQNVTSQGIERQLIQANRFFAEAISGESAHQYQFDEWDLNDYVRALSAGSVIRVTVMTIDGTVLADSHADPSRMENHIDRPEMRSAILGSPRFVTRYSNTLEYELTYYAARFGIGGSRPRDLVVRTAIPLVEVRQLLHAGYRLIILISFILTSISLVIIYFQLEAIRRPLDKILLAAEQIERNEWDLDLYVLRPYEFARIARALKDMARTLRGQISDLQEQKDDLRQILNIQKDPVIVLDRYEGIVNCNLPALRFLLSTNPGVHSGAVDLGGPDGIEVPVEREEELRSLISGNSLMTYIRSSDLNRIIDEATEMRAYRRGTFAVYVPAFREYECYVTPYSGLEFEVEEEEKELFLLVIYAQHPD